MGFRDFAVKLIEKVHEFSDMALLFVLIHDTIPPIHVRFMVQFRRRVRHYFFKSKRRQTSLTDECRLEISESLATYFALTYNFPMIFDNDPE